MQESFKEKFSQARAIRAPFSHAVVCLETRAMRQQLSATAACPSSGPLLSNLSTNLSHMVLSNTMLELHDQVGSLTIWMLPPHMQ